MTVTPDEIASLVQQEYDKLPAKRKPVIRDNGIREWVPLAGIVAEGKDGKLTCISLATGMKCLPSSKLSQAQGNVLHDWHAEILCIRAFNRFVLDECHALASGLKTLSDFIRRQSSSELPSAPESKHKCYENGLWDSHPFAWREDVILHMYCSEAPCGDASMELTMAAQEDASPWPSPEFQNSSSAPVPTDLESLLPGRAYFSQLGIVRRKPSRGDAPPTLSKSCSDKLSLHQCTSLLSSLTSLLVSPENAYLSTLILPKTQYSASGCSRAFSDSSEKGEGGRMTPLKDKTWGAGYAFRPFVVKTTSLEFRFSRRAHFTSTPSPAFSFDPTTSTLKPPKITPSNLSVAVTLSGQVESTLFGVLQGRKASSASIAGASFTSRRKMWALTLDIVNSLQTSALENSGRSGDSTYSELCREISEIGDEDEGKEEPNRKLTYGEVKNSEFLEARRRVKQEARTQALQVWVRNLGDEEWHL
ncbi:adenosine deaminase/editase [Xylariaceae sp. FL1272]|nr:adenosine deaminase/editase [Xylariaceae sp. FL1272]